MGELLGPGDAALFIVFGFLFLVSTMIPLSPALILLWGFVAGTGSVEDSWMETAFRLGFLVLLGICFTVLSGTFLQVLAPGGSPQTVLSFGPLAMVASEPRPGAYLGAWILGASAVPVRQILRENRERLMVFEEAYVSVKESFRDRWKQSG